MAGFGLPFFLCVRNKFFRETVLIRTLEAQREPVAEFDERLWGAMVDYVTVGVDGGMTVVFRDGPEISIVLCSL